MTDQFLDPYEGRIGVPTVSWKYARVKDGIQGIILPQKNGDSEVAYRLAQQSNIQGDLLWWNRPDGTKYPRVQQDFLLGDLRNANGQPIGDRDFISNKALERFESAAGTGETSAIELIKQVNEFRLRRQIVKGESLEKGFKAAVASVSQQTGSPRPVIGITVKITLEKLEANDHGGETKIYLVTFTAPTDETRQFVERYRAATANASDPYAGGGSGGSLTHEPGTAGTSDDEDPPF